ncbi:MAG: hypothetical protein HC897_14660 [Thermoanaerobaculia bacterium]|nr:hypothetical protein [Thermoanaerobaculia bacterium]
MLRLPAMPYPAAIALTLLLTTASAFGAGEDDPLGRLEWRNVGPVNMSGRVADVEGLSGDPRIVYVGTASGGIWKTTDGGMSFAPIFDAQPTLSIGDLALAPSNPEVIYAGTGEGNVRNSVSFGTGVYRSLDGGTTWSHLGLEKTRYIARIAVDPQNPDVAFVAAVGNIYAPSPERGVFRTRDGGKSWEKVLYLDEHHGAADLDLDPQNPNVVFAALWRFERKPWKITSGSEEGGVWRSLDGGTTWTKLGKGLPKLMGRIGVKVAPSNPRVVYVIAESNEGTLFRSEDRGETFVKVSDDTKIVSRGFYYTDLRVDPQDENTVYPVASQLFRSIDGGKSFERISAKTHVDFHSLWIDPQNPRRMWQGQDGGVAVSHDGGERWQPIRNLPIGQFYQVFADARQPFYYLGGGLQDNGTWYGPSRSRERAGILSDEWRMMSFGDAYWVVPHPEEVDHFLSESQAGASCAPTCAPASRSTSARSRGAATAARSPSSNTVSTGIRRSWFHLTMGKPFISVPTWCGRRPTSAPAGRRSAPTSPPTIPKSKSRPAGRCGKKTPPPNGTARSSAWPNRPSSPGCCGPAPMTATCRFRATAAATGKTSSKPCRVCRRSRRSRTSSPRAPPVRPPTRPSTATCSTICARTFSRPPTTAPAGRGWAVRACPWRAGCGSCAKIPTTRGCSMPVPRLGFTPPTTAADVGRSSTSRIFRRCRSTIS